VLEPPGLTVLAMEADSAAFDPHDAADHTHHLWTSHEYRIVLRSV